MSTATMTTESTDTANRTPFVFEIREGAFEKLAERFAKFTRRARKCKATPPRFEVIWERDEEKVSPIPNMHETPSGDTEYSYDKTITRFLYVTVAGERPTVPGWTFVATIDHTDEDNIIKGVPGESNIPVEFRKALPVCHHCGTARMRMETFVLRGEDGGYKQVGRNCLADFLASGSLTDTMTSLSWWTEAVEMALASGDEGGYGGGSGYNRHTLVDVVAKTQMVIENHGWMSKSRAGEYDTPTSTWVHGLFRKPEKDDSEKLKALRLIPVTDAHRAEAEKAIEWGRSIDAGTEEDYLYNLHTIVKGETVRADRFGLACSLLPAYRRAMGETYEGKKREVSTSEYVGTVGERQVFKGLVLEKVGEPIASDWGTSTLLTFKDEAGNVMKWFMGGCNAVVEYAEDGSPVYQWTQGATYDLVMTVTGHSEFRGKKETKVNRVNVWDGKWKAKKKKAAK